VEELAQAVAEASAASESASQARKAAEALFMHVPPDKRIKILKGSATGRLAKQVRQAEISAAAAAAKAQDVQAWMKEILVFHKSIDDAHEARQAALAAAALPVSQAKVGAGGAAVAVQQPEQPNNPLVKIAKTAALAAKVAAATIAAAMTAAAERLNLKHHSTATPLVAAPASLEVLAENETSEDGAADILAAMLIGCCTGSILTFIAFRKRMNGNLKYPLLS
jgi:hypothetical protein